MLRIHPRAVRKWPSNPEEKRNPTQVLKIPAEGRNFSSPWPWNNNNNAFFPLSLFLYKAGSSLPSPSLLSEAVALSRDGTSRAAQCQDLGDVGGKKLAEGLETYSSLCPALENKTDL